MTQLNVPLSKDELEALIRRVVREERLYLCGSPTPPFILKWNPIPGSMER